MKFQSIRSFALATMLVTSSNGQQLGGADNFEDNSKDPAKWGADLDFDLGSGQLDESNGRVNFSSTSTDYSYIARPWSANQASYVRDWEVQLDTVIAADSGLDQFGGVGLEIWNSADPEMYVGIEHDNEERSPRFYSYATTPLAGPLADASTRSAMVSGAIRIAFDSRSKILTTYCDSDGAADGYQWTMIGSYGVAGYGGATDNSNWKMNDSSGFTVVIFGVSNGTNIPAGQFHMDRFAAATRPAGPGVKLRGTDNFNDNSKDCRRRFKTGFLAGSKPDSLLEAESA